MQTPEIATAMASGRLRHQRRCSETSHDPRAIPLMAMGVLMKLGVAALRKAESDGGRVISIPSALVRAVWCPIA